MTGCAKPQAAVPGKKCQGTTSVVPIQPIISIGALAPVMLHDSLRKCTKCHGTDSPVPHAEDQRT